MVGFLVNFLFLFFIEFINIISKFIYRYIIFFLTTLLQLNHWICSLLFVQSKVFYLLHSFEITSLKYLILRILSHRD
ncbi:hypothetical protein CULT_2570001 [[Clostridium] ultunense Esp]|nr:hypothetical protein CULT_2570001 [[Clostridium] ultunense Esp]